ncbi:MAG: hypothetical protein HC834_07785, partial [Rhodospirillales bacterium]|nr:hypothetical protein [Rhodospirillales bacterium]
MLTLPPLLQAMTERQEWPRATDADLSLIRAIPPLEVPETYLAFIARFGFLEFDPLDDPCEFDYEYREPEMRMTFSDAITAFMPADYIQRYYEGLVLDEDEDLPKFPAFMLPICFTPSQSHVLLECGGESDRVWFWEFQGDAWGEGVNVRLGFVAQTFQGFLDKLRISED